MSDFYWYWGCKGSGWDVENKTQTQCSLIFSV